MKRYKTMIIYKPLFEKKISKSVIKNIIKGMTVSEIVLYNWDKIAFGISIDDIIEIPLKDLNIKWEADMLNVDEYSMSDYFNNISFKKLPLIEVSYENSKFYIEDGHHRYGYAKELELKKVKARVSDIRENPILALGFNSVDDIIKLKN